MNIMIMIKIIIYNFDFDDSILAKLRCEYTNVNYYIIFLREKRSIPYEIWMKMKMMWISDYDLIYIYYLIFDEYFNIYIYFYFRV